MARVNHLTISGGVLAGKTQAALAYAASAVGPAHPVLFLVETRQMIPIFQRRLAEMGDGLDRVIEFGSITALVPFHVAGRPYRTVVVDAHPAPSEWAQVKSIAQRGAELYGLSWLVTTQDALTL